MLAWMDLEMTGLDPTTEVIVEIATLITNDNLEIIAEGPDLVISASNADLDSMVDVVREMHVSSGLLALIEASDLTIKQAGDQTLAFLKKHISKANTVPLCGNSIGTDRRFLAKYLPEIEEFLHYRSIDVSTIKELARRWNSSVHRAKPKKQGSHRALDDIRESIDELRYYRDHLFCIEKYPPPIGSGKKGS